MRDRLGFAAVVTGYGLTETTGTVSMCRHDDPIEIVATTSGRPIPGMAVRVVGTDGVDAPAGTPGEVLVKGFAVMRAISTTGGDRRCDQRRRLATDRRRRRARPGGQHPDHRPDQRHVHRRWLQRLPAEIETGSSTTRRRAGRRRGGARRPARRGGLRVRHPAPRSTTTAEELIGWCRAVMANFKAPRYVQLVENLPLNASGKVVKFELRTRAEQVVRDAASG